MNPYVLDDLRKKEKKTYICAMSRHSGLFVYCAWVLDLWEGEKLFVRVCVCACVCVCVFVHAFLYQCDMIRDTVNKCICLFMYVFNWLIC